MPKKPICNSTFGDAAAHSQNDTHKQMKKEMTEKGKYKIKLGFIEIAIIVISFLLIGFAFFAPSLFVKEASLDIDFSNTGQIGDTIGGIMNPFIAIAGVLLTFLAFYIQYKANRLQRDLFRDELDEQSEQFRKTQFENQFYEMLRLHKENVNEIQIDQTKFQVTRDNTTKVEVTIHGARAFDLLLSEFEVCFYVAKMSFPDKDYKIWINEGYGAFFHGVNSKKLELHPFFKKLDSINESYSRLFNGINKILDKESVDYNLEKELSFSLFHGHSSQLAHYYRHLFQTVKFITAQDNQFITYEEKRKYLRILRSQLSNQEQALLFYNWLSNFGKQWENEINKFFTDYRMIHNIYQDLLVIDIKLVELFDLKGSYLKEKDRIKDSLFEFQDWG